MPTPTQGSQSVLVARLGIKVRLVIKGSHGPESSTAVFVIPRQEMRKSLYDGRFLMRLSWLWLTEGTFVMKEFQSLFGIFSF